MDNETRSVLKEMNGIYRDGFYATFEGLQEIVTNSKEYGQAIVDALKVLEAMQAKTEQSLHLLTIAVSALALEVSILRSQLPEKSDKQE